MRAMLLVMLLVGSGAEAFQLRKDSGGHPVRWGAAVGFAVDPGLPKALDAPHALDAVRGAISTYRRAVPQLRFSLSDDPSLRIGYDLSSVVQENAIAVPPAWAFEADAIAVTVITVDDSSHRVVDADIALNPNRAFRVLPAQGDPSSPYDDIQNTLTHEIGHVLGLAHDPNDPAAVMFPTAAAGETSKRTLSDDDLAALHALYGAPNDVGCSAGLASPGLPLALLLLVGFLAIRPRKHRDQTSSRASGGAVWTAALVSVFAFGTAGHAAPRPSALSNPPVDAKTVAPVREAKAVGMGRVLSVRTLPPSSPGPHVFWSELTLSVDRCLKGDCPTHVSLKVPGGRFGHFEQWVADSPVPSAGDAVGLTFGRDATRVYDRARPDQARAFSRGLETAGLEKVPGTSR